MRLGVAVAKLTESRSGQPAASRLSAVLAAVRAESERFLDEQLGYLTLPGQISDANSSFNARELDLPKFTDLPVVWVESWEQVRPPSRVACQLSAP